MHQEEKIIFSLLKKEIAATMMRSYPGIDPEISNWKGQEITDFQEELIKKVNGQLSEKWFYTHMKAECESLPRIDVLNILSQYAGYQQLAGFQIQEHNSCSSGRNVTEEPMNFLIRIPLLFLAVMILLFIILKMINIQNYQFTFIDSDTGVPVINNNLRAEVLMENESPRSIKSDEKGSITVRTNKSEVNMIVKAPYYLTDTVERVLRKFKRNEQISIKPDYSALMISYFSKSDVNSWEKRREQLDSLFSEEAIIYQFPENRSGNAMAIYNKWEFIDKITMPSSGMRQIEIVDNRYLDGKIVILRFRIKNEME